MITETRERFIRAIAERLPADRIVEAYFFPSIRQGPVETGVAVIAATPHPGLAAELAEPAQGELLPDEPEAPDATTPAAERAEVFTASYRWTRKGAERGAWVVDVVTEAHAPLTTVETVVRGVQERAGEALDAHRMSGDEVRATLLALAAPAAPAAVAPDAAATPA